VWVGCYTKTTLNPGHGFICFKQIKINRLKHSNNWEIGEFWSKTTWQKFMYQNPLNQLNEIEFSLKNCCAMCFWGYNKIINKVYNVKGEFSILVEIWLLLGSKIINMSHIIARLHDHFSRYRLSIKAFLAYQR